MTKPAGPVQSSHNALVRLTIGAVIGLVAGIATALVLGVAAGVLAGWGVAALVVSVWILVTVWPMDHDETRAHAQREVVGRRVARMITIIGSLVSLVAVGVVVAQAANEEGWRTYVLAGLSVVSVVASWMLIQTDYMLRYASIYYRHPHGGIDFNDKVPPQYTDFIYFSVGLGMTYQVADTDVSTKELRKIIIAQTVLAYVFATVIIATVINMVTSLA